MSGLIEFSADEEHFFINFRKICLSDPLDDLLDRVGDAKVFHQDAVFGKTKDGAGCPGVAIKHSADTSRIDEMCLACKAVKGGMGMPCDDDIRGCILGELDKVFQRCVRKKKFVWILGAAMENPDGEPLSFTNF